jgi:hypothetical protein
MENKNSNICFMYVLNGIDREFLVIRQYGTGWLCASIGEFSDDEFYLFCWEVIRAGQMRWNIQNIKHQQVNL